MASDKYTFLGTCFSNSFPVLQIRIFRMAGDFFCLSGARMVRTMGVGWPSLKTLNEGPGAKSQKTFNLEDFKS